MEIILNSTTPKPSNFNLNVSNSCKLKVLLFPSRSVLLILITLIPCVMS